MSTPHLQRTMSHGELLYRVHSDISRDETGWSTLTWEALSYDEHRGWHRFAKEINYEPSAETREKYQP